MKINIALQRIILSAFISIPKRIPVGGQAVIEGVLMKGPEHWGLAVREPGGSICLQAWLGSDWIKKGIWKYPVVRGFATMVEMMRIGMRALSISAEISLGEEDKISPLEMAGAIAVAVFAVAGLFVALPMLVSEYLTSHLGLSPLSKNIIEGIIRGIIFVGYVAVIGLWKDIQRVFAYHGAEHKTINAYENDAELTPESVSGFSRIHRRCGTSFLLVVIFVSIIVFSAIGGGSLLWRIGSRVLLLPLVIGISYEFIKEASNSETWGKYCIMPALSLQYITTREPALDQIEVALAALDLALHPEKAAVTKPCEAAEKSPQNSQDIVEQQSDDIMSA
ncbi:MAG: DUF1385 domain-containing protein [Synergistaceae bacterium]|nr:DUF1385 domain-containing protein [Synergistaceae bacterium]